MFATAKTAATPVFAILVIATLISYSVGAEHGVDNNRVATVLVLTIAFAKAYMVGLYFQELRHAPLWLRTLFRGWCLVGWTAVVGIYLLG